MKKLFVIFFLLIAVSGWCVGSSTQTLAEVSNYPKLFAHTNAVADTTIQAERPATYTTVVVDSHSGYDGIATYTVKVPGYYDADIVDHGNPSADTYLGLYIYVNGSRVSTHYGSLANGSIGIVHGFLRSYYLNSGDTVSASFVGGTSGISRYAPWARASFISIRRIP